MPDAEKDVPACRHCGRPIRQLGSAWEHYPTGPNAARRGWQGRRCPGLLAVAEPNVTSPVGSEAGSVSALLFCRECSEGKHRNCDGTAWDNDTDAPAPCTCPDPSHMPARAAAAIADLVTDDAKARGL